MNCELVIVNHRKHRIKVHECMALWNLQSDNFLKFRTSKQICRHRFDRFRCRTLANTDCHCRAIQDKLIAALHRELLIAIVPYWNIFAGKPWMMVNDVTHEQ